MKNVVEIEVGGHTLKIETGRWAKLSNGSTVLSYKDNMILVTANYKESKNEIKSFLPLMVDFRESTYSAGKIPGGFFKREGKPSEREVLLSRLIDRPMRPLFPTGYFMETQIIAMLLSADFSIDYDSMGIIGASASLLSSTIPFTTPVAAVKVGWKGDQLIVNPGLEQLADLDIVVQVAGTENDVVMIEAGGKEFSEDMFKKSLIEAKEIISEICRAQAVLINPDKTEVVEDAELKGFYAQLKKDHEKTLQAAIFSGKKEDRHKKINEIIEGVIEGEEDETKVEKLKLAFHDLEYDVFRSYLLANNTRPDGRKFDEVRDINIELGILPRVHGSAIFTRGETQALATITLGADDDAKRVDDLSSSGELKKFMLHYNFPPFSVGEVSFLRGAGRREIGHGNLAEKSLSYVLPDNEEFPYTIRVVSEILESNGSSSMATVCGGALALMHAGVPIKSPVAGIAMGLVKADDKFAVLTDIAGYEDHFGDMDFKIAGTEKGITAVQLDIKMGGLSDEIINQTLMDAQKARLHILAIMKTAIPGPAEKLSDFAPVILTTTISTEKIKDLIGPGGKIIKGLIADFGVKINADDDGKVTVAAPNQEVGDQVIKKIRDITATVEVNKVYTGKIVRIEDYGIFVEILNGAVGLVHISELAPHRIRNIKDENFRLGQEIEVKSIGVDRDNRLKLSKKAVGEKSRDRSSSRDGHDRK